MGSQHILEQKKGSSISGLDTHTVPYYVGATNQGPLQKLWELGLTVSPGE